MLASFLIAVPTGVKIFNWVATLWRGTIEFKTALLFCVGFIGTFLVGGITGVFLAVFPVDWQLTDTYFVVAHLHYVLMGGAVFGVFAGIYYWFPKITGRLLSEGLGEDELLADAHRLPRHLPHPALARPGRDAAARLRVPRRRPPRALQHDLDGGLLRPRDSACWSRPTRIRSVKNGPIAGPDPWRANTLEWFTTSPPPVNNFDVIPRVRSVEPMKDIRRQVERQMAPRPTRPRPPGGRIRGAHLMAAPARQRRRRSRPSRARHRWLADYVAADQAARPVAAALHDGDDDARRGVAVAAADPLDLPGRLSVGRRRRRRQPRLRPRHRRAHGAHGRPAGARGARLGARGDRCSASVLAALSVIELLRVGQSAGRRPLLLRLRRLHARLHGVAQAPHAAQHRHRRRGGRVPPRVAWAAVTGGLDGMAVLPLRERLLLDAAALLGAVAAHAGRLRARRVPMLPVARGETETRRQILLYSVLLYAVTQLPFCAGGLTPIILVASFVLGVLFIGAAWLLQPPRRPALGPAPVPVLARLSGPALRRDGRRRQALGSPDQPPSWTAISPARTSAPA